MSQVSSSPLVSVIIVNYKRREAFLRSLDSVRRQTYPKVEIIVVDNASGDGIRELLNGTIPEVRLIELPENRGATGGRNAGIEAARGEIIITLDNDVFFESALEITKTVETFASRPDIHVLSFQLGDEKTGALRIREWCHPRSWTEYGDTEFETNYFVEGSCAARTEVYRLVGAYYEPFFIGCEGWDLSLRLLDQGFRILYTPHIRVRHLMSAETRTNERPYYFWTRNYIWITYKDYPLSAGVPFLALKLLMMFYFSLRSGSGCVKAYLRGVKDGVAGIKGLRAYRKPVRSETINYLRQLESWRPGLWVRLSRHREAVQL
jgi:GT2 family glycosyltransferase